MGSYDRTELTRRPVRLRPYVHFAIDRRRRVDVRRSRVGAGVGAGRHHPRSNVQRRRAPILYKNCTNCHRPGEIAPMSLLTNKETRPWAKSIANQVSRGRMPPWHADPAHGEFLNDRRLSAAGKDLIAKWAR
jgi:hypothetical protein